MESDWFQMAFLGRAAPAQFSKPGTKHANKANTGQLLDHIYDVCAAGGTRDKMSFYRVSFCPLSFSWRIRRKY